MKLTCMAQMFNEHTKAGWDKQTNLSRFIRSIAKYCDALVMYDDCSTDGSVGYLEMCKKSLSMCGVRLKEIHVIHGQKNDFKHEMEHKAEALSKCREIGTDWVIWLDVDEVIEARGEKGRVRELCEAAKRGAYNLFNVNLWRTDRYYRVDELWNKGLFCRLWRLTSELHYKPQEGLHQDLVPKGIIGRDTAKLKVIHYGFVKDSFILDKYFNYRKHGQSGRALARLIDEESLRLADISSVWFDAGPHGPTTMVYDKRLVELVNENCSNDTGIQ